MSALMIEQPAEPAPATSNGSPAVERFRLEPPELDAIYEEHSRSIFYLALRFLGDPTQAEDATHDVFLKAFRKLDQFQGHSSLRTWLYSITIHHCQNLLHTWHHRHIHTTADDALWANTPSPADSP